VLRIITVLGKIRRAQPSSPPTAGQEGLRERVPAVRVGRAALDHGEGTHYAAYRASNTRLAPPTTGSSSMDQGVGRSVWVEISGIRCQVSWSSQFTCPIWVGRLAGPTTRLGCKESLG
jgi:hypothetical protein